MLKGYLNTEYDLREDVLKLLEGKEVPVDVLSFQNNISSFQSKDDVLTLLIHLGYLGYNSESKSVYIPNKEVKDEFVVAIKNSSWGFITKLAKNSQELLEATINMDEEKVSKYLEVIHDDVESKQYNSEYALSAVINIAYIAARDEYTVIQEFPSGKGYADIAYIPKPGIHKPAMVIELKYEQDAETAIDQIKKKNYPKKLEHYLDNLLLVGINYNKDKEHECIIEKYR
jgi:nitrogen fixation protein